jgi:DNA-binding beta-propeller fold protein YncE
VWRRIIRPRTLAFAAALAASLGGCGGGGSAGGGSGCPGATGECPYHDVVQVGRRAEGVLRAPEAIAVAPNGDVYVADQFSHVVQRFSGAGAFLSEWGSYGDGHGRFGAVDGLAVDGAGNVYALDASHDRIQKFDAAGHFLLQWGRPGHGPGQFDFGAGQGPDKPPGGAIAVHGGDVYVSDTNNNRLQRFALDGSGARVIAGGFGTVPGRFYAPRGLAVTNRAIYVADDGNHRVDVLDLQGRFRRSVGRFGYGPGEFSDAYSVALDGGDLYVADDNGARVEKFTATALRYVGSLGTSGRGAISIVRSVAADGSGRIVVADTGHYRIVVFSPQGKVLAIFGISGNAPGQFTTPVGVAATPAGGMYVLETYGSRSPIYGFSPSFSYLSTWRRGGGAILGHHWFSPTSASIAPDGSMWVTDRLNGLVRHLSPGGTFLGAVGAAAGLALPNGVALGPGGQLYVADSGNDRIVVFAPGGRVLHRWGSGRLLAPAAVAVTRSGIGYVADTGHDRVVEIGRQGTVVRTFGAGMLMGPSGIAVDAAGAVFVSDTGHSRVLKFSPVGRLLASWGREGPGPGELSLPAGIATDCRGDVLVADRQNNRVQVFVGAAAPGACAAA